LKTVFAFSFSSHTLVLFRLKLSRSPAGRLGPFPQARVLFFSLFPSLFPPLITQFPSPCFLAYSSAAWDELAIYMFNTLSSPHLGTLSQGYSWPTTPCCLLKPWLFFCRLCLTVDFAELLFGSAALSHPDSSAYMSPPRLTKAIEQLLFDVTPLLLRHCSFAAGAQVSICTLGRFFLDVLASLVNWLHLSSPFDF